MPLNHPANLEGPDVVKHVSFAPSDRFRFIHNDLPHVYPLLDSDPPGSTVLESESIRSTGRIGLV